MSPTVPLQQDFSKKRTNNRVVFFICFWFIINILQASFMELTSDEGYYWFYSQHLQWGYYDHPPMIALMIRLGSYLFSGELGVRFFNVAFSTAGLYLFFKLLPFDLKANIKTYLVLLSAPLLHYFTFLVFPDGPLLFFSLTFLILYRRFLQNQNLLSAILLGIALALMLYSKYYGVLVLLFTIIANPRLFKSAYFYLSLFLAAAFFLPHLWWQYKNNFQTIKYHLLGRTGTWSFEYVGEYLSQQVVAIGPGLIFIPFVVKTKDVFERTLKFVIIGTFFFFLLCSFKTFVHFHWTSIVLYPLLYFAVGYYDNSQKNKLFNWLILPTIVFLFAARFLLMAPLIQGMHVGEDYYHDRKHWAEDIKKVAGDRPVFMPNNLRDASLYAFYSKSMGVTLYSIPEKKSQYELWGYEDSLQNKDVLFVNKYPFGGATELATRMKQQVYCATIPFFHSYFTGIDINATTSNSHFTDTIIHASVDIINLRKKVLLFNANTFLIYSIKQDNTVIKADTVQQLSVADNLQPGASLKKSFDIPIKGLPKGEYEIYFGIRSGILPDVILSKGNDLIKN